MPKKTSENKRGKRISIDIQLLEDLCAMQCTDDELAAVFKCTSTTINNRKRNPDFKEAYQRGKLRGKVSLRRLMWRKAQGQEAEFLIDSETGKIVRDDKSRPILKMPGITPDTTMQIWLSKNLLGYADRVEHTGQGGGPVEVNIDAKGKLLSLLNIQAARDGEKEGDQQPVKTGSPGTPL